LLDVALQPWLLQLHPAPQHRSILPGVHPSSQILGHGQGGHQKLSKAHCLSSDIASTFNILNVQMLRMQFVKAIPSVVVRGEWFAIDIRIVNESNGSVKITTKVLNQVAAVSSMFFTEHLRLLQPCLSSTNPEQRSMATAYWMPPPNHPPVLMKVHDVLEAV
jgi:hypothetical protein